LTLLRELGISPRVAPASVPERMRSAEPAREMVLRLARAKAAAVAARLRELGEGGVVLGADTAVVLEGSVLGKPRGPAEAVSMLRRLSGKTHEVLTGVALIRLEDGRDSGGVERTRVRFAGYGEQTIQDYVATGEPLDKAGAYGIQGGGARLAERIEGSWSNVVGLPLERLEGWLREVGVELAELRAPS
jgi:septum formation protein